MTEAAPAILWFRQDLRLADNPALNAATDGGRPTIPVFVLDDDTPGRWAAGGASRWWLHHSLTALADSLAAIGLPLMLRRGRAGSVIPALARETGAGAVFWNRCYEAQARGRDEAIKHVLKEQGVEARSFNGSLLHEPWTVATRHGDAYSVYTPFARACLQKGDPERPATPPREARRGEDIASDRLEDWALLPSRPDWAGGLRETWAPGEAAARARLEDFLENRVATYKRDRDRPGIDGTSGLSPHLHWGEISPRTAWHATRQAMSHAAPAADTGGDTFLRELLWREFSYHLLYHHPGLPETALREQFRDFPWANDPEGLLAWQAGRTGYPIVDAGMRQLWHCGWMHNRVRMISASFLIKDLLLPWQEGERWFWDTLVDADLANNSASWQWVAGCGADAAPYFRIFNPVLQGRKFDPDGAYVRQWVPELARLPDKHLHAPWEAPDRVLEDAGVTLGDSYPRPVVDHGAARKRALDAFERIRRG